MPGRTMTKGCHCELQSKLYHMEPLFGLYIIYWGESVGGGGCLKKFMFCKYVKMLTIMEPLKLMLTLLIKKKED